MMRFSAKEFNEKYGIFNLQWFGVTIVDLSDDLNVTTYAYGKILSTFCIVKHEDVYVIHGEYVQYCISSSPFWTKEVRYFHLGQHNDNGEPAIRKWNGDNIVEEIWKVKNVIHRVNGPAVSKWNDEKLVLEEKWYKNGYYHRDDGPAIYKCGDDLECTSEYWYKDGKLHREDAPAKSGFNYKYLYEKWYKNGVLHRENGPAYCKWKVVDDDLYELTKWYYNGEEYEPTLTKCAI